MKIKCRCTREPFLINGFKKMLPKSLVDTHGCPDINSSVKTQLSRPISKAQLLKIVKHVTLSDLFVGLNQTFKKNNVYLNYDQGDI